MDSTPVEENDMVDKYSIPEPPPQAAEVDEVVEETPAEESYVSYPPLMDAVQEPLHVPVEERAEEPTKQTYASIVCTILIVIILLLSNKCCFGLIFISLSF